eukprot:SAG31_NODE_394_length_16282_cov_132.890564_11_plen_458_part_00
MLPPSLDDLRRRQQQPAPSLQKQRARGRDRVADALPKPNAVIRKPTAAGAASSASQARPKPEPESESELEPGQPPDKAMHARLEPQPEPNSAGAGKGQTQLEKRKKQQSPRAPLLPSLDDLRGRQQQPAPSLQKQRARIKTFEIVRAKLLMRAKVWALSDQNLKDTWDEHLKASASRHRLQYGTYQRGPTLGRNEAEDRQEKTMTNKAPKTREKKYKERGTIDLRGCSPFDGGNSIEQVNPVWWRRLRSIGLNRRFITEQHLNDPSLNRTAGRYVGDGKGSNCFTPYDFSENNEPLIIIIDGEASCASFIHVFPRVHVLLCLRLRLRLRLRLCLFYSCSCSCSCRRCCCLVPAPCCVLLLLMLLLPPPPPPPPLLLLVQQLVVMMLLLLLLLMLGSRSHRPPPPPPPARSQPAAPPHRRPCHHIRQPQPPPLSLLLMLLLVAWQLYLRFSIRSTSTS